MIFAPQAKKNHPGRIIAVSGTHGTGKTTAAYTRAADLKKQYPQKTIGFICETATLCPYPINREACPTAQAWIFHAQIKAELDALYWYDMVVSDRTCIDAIAYTWCLGFHELALAMIRMAGVHVQNYKEIHFHLAKDHPCCFDDGVRDQSDDQWRSQVESEMLSIYSRFTTMERLRYV